MRFDNQVIYFGDFSFCNFRRRMAGGHAGSSEPCMFRMSLLPSCTLTEDGDLARYRLQKTNFVLNSRNDAGQIFI